VPPHKRARIAEETMDIYAPLAGRMGMQDMREELEELAFRHINPGSLPTPSPTGWPNSASATARR
jgi:guanosine-3',5'-bis(diphosphate) 3'-pyrophosphohydrolase